ncbi:MAG: site-specific integrase, partial [Bacilli bacterium]|nr:site-specific integrase [Bacilli bacterium]
YYTDMYGNRKQKKSKAFASKTIALEEERKFLIKVKTTDDVDKNILFQDVYNNWLNYKKNKVKISTYYGIKKGLDKHILNYFQKFKLYGIKINVLNDWKTYLISKRLSLSKTNAIIGYMKEILLYASTYYEFDIKIANYLDKVRDDTPQDKPKNSEENFLTKEEFDKFIAHVDKKFYKLVFTFLYKTGLRIGEFVALTWKDIDLEKKTLKITKSASHNSFEKGSIIISPKTSNSIREIDLDNNLVFLMKEYKEQEMKTYGFTDSWYIFGGVNYLGLTTLRRYLNLYLEKANVKRITIHGFRHSHVSLLIYLGCDVRDVAERIGDTVEMVEKTYYHMFHKKKKETIYKLNNLQN